MPRWTFIRHAESVANAEGWLAGHHDAQLTARGCMQARALAAELRGHRFDAGYCSDALRARHTAALALADHDLLVSSTAALRERSLGDWERVSRKAVVADGRIDTLLAWDQRPPGGESIRDVAVRALRFLARVDDGTPSLVIVAHSTTLRAVLGVIDGAPVDAIGRSGYENAGVRRRELAPGAVAAALARVERL